MDFKKEIGRRIRDSRNAREWSLVRLAQETKGVLSDTRISNYETGERMPGPHEAVILAKALGQRPAFLLAVDDVQIEINAQEEKFIQNWRKLPEKDRMRHFREVEQLAMVYRDSSVNDDRVPHPPKIAVRK